MDSVVYVVYQYSDNRKENTASIIAVCTTRQTSLEKLHTSVNKFAAKYEGTIENFDNGANVIWGDNYEVFVIDTIPLSN